MLRSIDASNKGEYYGAFDNEKRKVEVCIMFVKLGEIDTVHEHFTADVMVKARWREPKLDGRKETVDFSNSEWKKSYWDPKLFVENTLGDPKESIMHKLGYDQFGKAYICENRRLKATFIENLELDDFPFDVQDLSVVLASERHSKEIEFTEDPLDMHRVCKRSFVDEQEWKLYKHIETAHSTYSDELVDDADHNKPLYVVRCRAARRPKFFIVNMYSFGFVIVMLVLTTFSVDYHQPEYRLHLTFALLLTTVTFKLVASNSLPRISYVTYLDQFNFVSLGMITVTCVWHAVVPKLSNGPFANIVFLVLMLILYLLFVIGYSAYIYNKVYEKRRAMDQLDNNYQLKMELASKP